MNQNEGVERQAKLPYRVASPFLIATGIGFLIVSTAFFLGQGPASGSEGPPVVDAAGTSAGSDVVLPLAPQGPAFDSDGARLLQMATATAAPTATLQPQPSLLPAGQPAAQPVAPVVVPTAVATVVIIPATAAPVPIAAPTAAPLPPTPLPPAPTAPPTPVPPPPPQAPSMTLTAFEADIYAGVNNERIAAGLAPLQIDAALVNVARDRSNDMIQKGYFGHVSPTGETAFTLLDRYGIPYGWAGENLARNNYPDDESVAVAMHDWMASQGHRENMLNVHYTNVGVGSAVDASGMKYFTVVFTGP